MKMHVIPYLLLLVASSLAAQPAVRSDPCLASSTASDVTLTLAVKDNRSSFQEGEIIPLVLSFTSSAKDRYWADVRNYDRSGRLSIERYCIQPDAPDPLESYFRVGTFFGGGLGTEQQIGDKAFTANAGTGTRDHWNIRHDGLCGNYANWGNRLAHRSWGAHRPDSLPRIARGILANEWRNRPRISCGSVAHAIDSSDAVRDWKYGRAHNTRIAHRSFRTRSSRLQN